jgi:hypothetical protein
MVEVDKASPGRTPSMKVPKLDTDHDGSTSTGESSMRSVGLLGRLRSYVETGKKGDDANETTTNTTVDDCIPKAINEEDRSDDEASAVMNLLEDDDAGSTDKPTGVKPK